MPPRGRGKYSLLELLHNKWERSPQIIIFSKNVEKINSDHHLFKVCLNLRTLSALLDVNKFLF